ncbi:hypothetical protein LTR53_004130 [Teratosphaeriaceae sp. CCFEE 6253]|nr:hypothetical protein LTR53_004130 [Teratosphaeriaceae sp. CCFEE 6253]
MASQNPYKLVTVNNAPERAKKVVGRVVEELKDRYTIHDITINKHLTATDLMLTATGPEAAKVLFEEIVPDVVFTASMWTPEQSSRVLAQAKEVNPACKTLAIPQGLQVEKGPEGVVDWVTEHLPPLLES